MPIRPDDELGTHVARVLSANYELESEVGRGGMGIVYNARDRRLKREIAIKVLPPEPASAPTSGSVPARSRDARSQSPTSCRLHREERDNLVNSLAYIAGDNIGAKEMHGDDPPRARWCCASSRFVAYAHTRTCYREIKPENIILDAETGRAWDDSVRPCSTIQEIRLTAPGWDRNAGYMSQAIAGDRASMAGVYRSLE